MPLVHGGGEHDEPARDEAHERARKIRPELTRGPLVRVAGGRNQAEAELIQNILLEEGVPSILRRTAGFDVPDFLAAGPRDVMVPESGAAAAAPDSGTRMSRGPAARKSGTSKPAVRRNMLGIPSSSSSPWIISASGWWRPPATRTSLPSV